MKKLLIIDGNSILNRAYYGIRPLTAPDGTPTNAVYGFLNILFKYLEEETPDYLCVAFDVKEKTFRHKMYDQYKSQRKPAPEDFLVQLPLIKDVLSAMNCLCLEKPGYEADDIIGTIARKCEESDIECKILTGDKDDLQLASDNTTIKLVITKMGSTTTTDYGITEFVEKYGFTPDSFIDLKALMGDSSDNIPGVKGVGEKTAMSLIQTYKSIDKIYESITSIDVTDSVRKKLIEGKDDAYLSYTLATIDKNVPIDFNFSNAERKDVNASELAQIFTRLNFRSFIQKLNLDNVAIEQKGTQIIDADGKEVSADALIKAAEDADFVSYIIDGKKLCIRPSESTESLICPDTSRETLVGFLENEKITKVGFNVKEDIIALSDYGIDFKEINARNIKFDVMLAAYILDPTQSEYRLDDLCRKYLSMFFTNATDASQNEQISMDSLLGGSILEDDYSSLYNNVYAIEMLYIKMAELINSNDQSILYYDVELPLLEVLADLQLRGMYIDKAALSDFGLMLDAHINQIRDEIYELSGEEFNINSPKQLGEILFNKLGLPFGKKNKRGSYSTNADVMEKLRSVHPIADKVLSYRQFSKLQSTYVEGLGAVINQQTGRIHSKFNQMVTTTGRISSTEPNMQNIPVRTKLGREIRKMFIAEKTDWCLIDADYSQIELRVLSHIADDEAMKSAFISGEDIHTQTASNVFGTPIEDVTSQMRSRAKAVNFGIVYGIGAFSLAQDIGTSRKEAEQYINDYLSHYSNVSEYMKKTIEDAKDKGYISTILKRRRYIPELSGSNHMLRAFGERVAMNAPIQGSAADIIKIAMVNVYKRLKAEGLAARLVLQVHDELIVEAPKSEKELAGRILKEEMENAYALSVPLVVDMNTGKSWYDTK